MSKITKLLKKNKILNSIIMELRVIKLWKRNFKARYRIKELAANSITKLKNVMPGAKYIFFCGIPQHKNLGDQAQKYCIERWIKENYPEHIIVCLPTWSFYDKKFRKQLESVIQEDAIFIIQSGYCTTSSHIDHEMHRYIVKTFCNNRILIMPQTILYNRKRDSRITRNIFKKNQKLLFLARDRKSYEDASKYFPETRISLFPDIVTTLIGAKDFCFNEHRNGILICVRNDSEKLYTNEQINKLAMQFSEAGYCYEIDDTNSNLPLNELQDNIESELKKTIRYFGRHKVIITDRYHGTIFSMISDTPVIVLATLDHKVKTGTEWFKGIYDGAYFNAESLDEAYKIACKIIENPTVLRNEAYFKVNYYDKLKILFEDEGEK